MTTRIRTRISSDLLSLGLGITAAAAVLFSPVHDVLAAKELAAWILEDRLPVRLQLQAHKFIWSPDTRGV